MSRRNLLAKGKLDAVFIGWLHPRSGGSIALYNVTVEDHPSFGSTVTAKTLRKLNLSIPPTPPLERETLLNSIRAKIPDVL